MLWSHFGFPWADISVHHVFICFRRLHPLPSCKTPKGILFTLTKWSKSALLLIERVHRPNMFHCSGQTEYLNAFYFVILEAFRVLGSSIGQNVLSKNSWIQSFKSKVAHKIPNHNLKP